MDRLEVKLDRLAEEMAGFRAEIRANMVTKTELAGDLRHVQGLIWTAIGVIVAAMALVAGLFQVLQAQSSRPAPASIPFVVQAPAMQAPLSSPAVRPVR